MHQHPSNDNERNELTTVPRRLEEPQFSLNASAFAEYQQHVALEDGWTTLDTASFPSTNFFVGLNLVAMLLFSVALTRRQPQRRCISYPFSSSFFLVRVCILSLALILLPLFLIHARIGHVISTTTDDVVGVMDDTSIQMVVPTKQNESSVTIAPPAAVIRAHDDNKNNDTVTAPACQAIVTKNTRIMLLTMVQALHGSTALASVIMSSPNIATYCSGKTWQCEGFAKAKQFACPSGRPKCLRDPRQLAPKQRQAQQGNVRPLHVLDLLSFDYNLTRPILHDKLFPREPGYTILWESTLARKEVSPQMAKVGIHYIQPVYIIMWTPLCVLQVQTTSRTALDGPAARHFLQKEVWNQFELQRQHMSQLERKIPVLVVSYADLLFDQEATLKRLNAFLPCAGGTLHTNFVPQPNVHVFPENKWKVRGTVHDFSQAFGDPMDCCGYSLSKHKCINRTYFELIPEFKDELKELEEYFTLYSTSQVVS